MKLLDRLLSFITPPAPACGHETELAQLRRDVAAARETAHSESLAHELAERRCSDLEAKLNEHVALLDEERLVRARAEEQYVEASAALEETTTRIVYLESELAIAIRGDARQLPLVAGPQSEPDEEPAHTAEDVIIAGPSVSEDAYQIGCVWFVGRVDHLWELVREDTRFKVPILDIEWLKNEVRSGSVNFSAGCSVRVLMETTTYQPANGGKPYVKRAVVKVLEFLPTAQQNALPFEEVVCG